jgi:WD40 repeat protein
MSIRRIYVNILTLVAVAFIVDGSCLGDDPVLVIDNGGHTASVRSIVFTSDGRRLVSAGDDKVIRVWDVASGRVQQTIRGEIAPGNAGKINAIALSSDDRLLAAAGFLTGANPTDTGAIRLYSLPGGEQSALLPGATNVTFCLAFSADTRLLASGSADFAVRIWEINGKRLVRTIKGNSYVRTLTFSKDGTSLAWGTNDGKVHVWDLSQNKMLREFQVSSTLVVSVAFSPDSRYLAAVDDEAVVNVLDTVGKSTTSFRGGAESATAPANLSFTPDGRGLLVTSHRGQSYVASIFDFPSGTPRISFSRHTELIETTAISPDGRIAATAGGERNQIYLWNTSTGALLKMLSGAGSAVWNVAFSRDAHSVAFGTERYTEPRVNARGPLQYVIHLADKRDTYHIRSDSGVSEFEAFPPIETAGGLELATDRNGSVLRITRGGAKLSEIARDATSGYRHVSYTLTPDGRYVISGGQSGALAIYSAENGRKVTDFVGHTGNVWGVGISPDGLTLVSGSDDQTVRLWDTKSGKNLLSFFLGDDREWVAWTPEGYYASSLNGDKYIGWHINVGNGAAAKYFNVAHFQKTYYRPDVVAEHLKDRDITIALRAANKVRGGPEQQVATPADVAVALPPTVYVADPANGATVQGATVSLKGTVNSNSLPITAVRVLLDGNLYREYKPGTMRQDLDLDIALTKGRHVLAVVASNAKASSESVVRQISSDQGTAPGRPDLYFLSVGISSYAEKDISLHYADKDAQELEGLLKKQQNGPVFNHVETKLLSNGDANRKSILLALRWLAASGSPGDTRVLFLAGHGQLGLGSSYFFCTYECRSDEGPEINGIGWHDLLDALRAGKGRAILMVDTCHASAVAGGRGLAPVDLTEVIRNSTADSTYTGITFITASQGSEYSLEKQEWGHGAFTKALIEGITGKAAEDGQLIKSDQLNVWLSRRVGELTAQRQHPTLFSEPRDAPAFPIFSVVK